MDGFFSKKKDVENDGESGKNIDMDRLSFTSFHESTDEDLYMSVQQSPCQSSLSVYESTSLFMTCEHKNEEQSCCDSLSAFSRLELDATACYSSEDPINDAIDLETQDELKNFTASLPDPSSMPKLPRIIGDRPYWVEYQDWLRCLRNADAEVSKDMEELNISIYSSSLALRALEETRWFNEVSKDPELSKLIHDIDSIFPIAMRRKSFSSINEVLEQSLPISYDLVVRHTDNSTFYLPNVPIESTVRSSLNGVDDIILRRKTNPYWYNLASLALHRAFTKDSVRDPRMEIWINDLTENYAQALSLPSSSNHNSEIICNGQVVHLRGCEDWAPPRDAWIFTPLKVEPVKTLLEQQKYRCAGCGVKIDQQYLKRVRLCEYYCKVFCQCCHQGLKSVIPSKILNMWNFKEFPVSDRAYRFLKDARDQPAIHIQTLAPDLISKISVLRKVIQMREKLGHMWEFIKLCSIAEETITKFGNLKTLFTSMERHLLVSSDLFSLSDLTRVYNKDLVSLLEPIVYYGKCHIESCSICKELAFVCCLCSDATDLLFPFQIEKVNRCRACGSLSHLKCHQKLKKTMPNKASCPKCTRIENQRRQKLAQIGDS
ncbi:unnamed protein product [Auanema sp. JU1783]|nr:unnamed protein product [Auanema sp. JU1783]